MNKRLGTLIAALVLMASAKVGSSVNPPPIPPIAPPPPDPCSWYRWLDPRPCRVVPPPPTPGPVGRPGR